MTQQWISDVERRLRAVEMMCNGAHVSVWACRGENIEFVAGRTTSDESDLVERVWLEYRTELRESRAVVEEGVTVVPLEAHLELTGLLVVGAPLPEDDIDRPYIERLARHLAVLLGHRPEAARLPLTVKVSMADLARAARGRRIGQDALVGLLQRCAGSKTAVARRLGVTRQTVHNWCRHYGIGKRKESDAAAPAAATRNA